MNGLHSGNTQIWSTQMLHLSMTIYHFVTLLGGDCLGSSAASSRSKHQIVSMVDKSQLLSTTPCTWTGNKVGVQHKVHCTYIERLGSLQAYFQFIGLSDWLTEGVTLCYNVVSIYQKFVLPEDHIAIIPLEDSLLWFFVIVVINVR